MGENLRSMGGVGYRYKNIQESTGTKFALTL
jgi:hypothetical protein